MTTIKALYVLTLWASLVFSALSTTAQTQPDQTSCETDEKFNEFNFWLGSWEVYDNANGNIVGSNEIEKVDKNCFIYENWTSINGSTGHSMNYYNPVTGLWRQLWIADGAYSIDFTGGLQDGKMVLEGKIYYYSQKAEFAFRGTWTPNKDGTVRQFFEQFNPKTKAWVVWFDGKYIRAKN